MDYGKKKEYQYDIPKKRQATYIAPLQPLILAAFRPWGGSVGAGRMRPANGKDTKVCNMKSIVFFPVSDFFMNQKILIP